MTTTRQAIIVAAMFAALALGVLSPSLLRADQAADKARAILIWGDTTASSGGTSPAIPAPVTPAKHDDTASVQATTPPAPVLSIKAGAKVKAATTWPRYPVRGSWWTGCGSWRHLTGGEHARHHFDPAWLASRTNAEIQSIHSDSHEGRLKMAYIVTTTKASSKEKAKATTSSSCPSGNCPNVNMRRSLFGWRR